MQVVELHSGHAIHRDRFDDYVAAIIELVGRTAAVVSPAAEVAAWLAEARSIVVLTGAGVSTESGIPDFRGPDGVWTRDPGAERLSNIGYYVADREVRRRSWQMRLEHPAWGAEPNAAHRALASPCEAAGVSTCS